LDTLYDLAAKSLLVRVQHAQTSTRLSMLQTIGAYASERFAAADDADAVRDDHYRYYLALAQRHATPRALRTADAREHLARLDVELDNLHAALGWAMALPSAERALTLAAALGPYWLMRNRYADAVDWVEQSLALPPANADPGLRVQLLCVKASALWPLGRGAEQIAVLVAAVASARALGDPVLLSRALRIRVMQEIQSEGYA